jgi:hypothetical protein
LVALKHGKFKSFMVMGYPAVVSPIAWWLLLRAIVSRRVNRYDAHINKFVLIEF